jgi:hypothetical protein
MEEIIMKTNFITISLAVLITAIFMNCKNALAIERELYLAEICFIDETDESSSILMSWMVNPLFFHQTEQETDKSSTSLEDWMLDIHHFNSAVFTESDKRNEVIESWMKRKGHFYSPLNTPLESRFKKLDNHLGEVKVIIAKR